MQYKTCGGVISRHKFLPQHNLLSFYRMAYHYLFLLIGLMLLCNELQASPSAADSLKVMEKKRVGGDTRKVNDSIMFYEIKLHQLMDSATQLYETRKQKLAEQEDVSDIDKSLGGIKLGNKIYRARLDSFIAVSQQILLSQPEIILRTSKVKQP